MKPLIAAAFALLASPALAQQAAPVAPAPSPAPAPASPTAARPKLIVAISVDQFSADLFAQYRNRFTRGFARLLNGVVFPSAYQSHAATETCPGHSTILTGMRPTHTGIIANDWVDQRVTRADKTVYCAEDETVAGSTSEHYTASDRHLRVPTLGERMKAADPRTRVVSVAGKDRAAIMMGGHRVDELWWWNGTDFVTYAGRAEPPVVGRARTAIAALIARPQEALALPGWCTPLDRPVQAGALTVGQGRFARAAGDARGFRYSPAFDAAIFSVAAGLIQEMRLGKGPTTDIISIGASATDYVGHAYGTQGTEMCIQLDQLDQTMGAFFDTLDSWGLDYEVVLTADHGGHDLPERNVDHAAPTAMRLDPDFTPAKVGAAIARQMGLTGPLLYGASIGDVWIDRTLAPAVKARVLAEAVRRARAHPQVAAVFTRDEIAATPMPSGPPETWSLIQRARASFDAERSGDFQIALKPRVTPIPVPRTGGVATHGSFWDYDRRVPLLFWRKGMTGFEQPLSVETVDIAPTLAATIGLPVSGLDGRCLDLDAGPGDSCRP